MSVYRRSNAPEEYDFYWLDQELQRLEQVLERFDKVSLTETNVAPAKPRLGDVRLADGVNWNPGSGAGFYGFYGGNWVKLG